MTPGCCCPDPDPHECVALRYGRATTPDGIPLRDGFPEPMDDEPCECMCHEMDIDGWTEWDDKETP